MGEIEGRADRLKERVYITFTALAVVLALRAYAGSAEEALLTLVIVVVGTLLASLLADAVAYLAVYSELPRRAGILHSLRVTGGAAASLILPVAFILLAVVDLWDLERALRAASIALVAALVAIGYLAARRARLPLWQKMLVLFGEFALGTAVVILESLTHG